MVGGAEGRGETSGRREERRMNGRRGSLRKKSGSARLANTGASRASSALGREYFYLAEDSISRGIDARQGRDESTRRRMTRRRARLHARLAGGPKSLVRPPRNVMLSRFFFPARFFSRPPFFFTERGAPPRIARTRGVRGETRRDTRDAPSHARGSPSSREAFLAQVCDRTRDSRARFARRRIEIPGTVARETRGSLLHASASSSPAGCARVRGFGPAGPAGIRGRGRTARGNPSRPPHPRRARRPSPPPRPRASFASSRARSRRDAKLLTARALPPRPQERTPSRLSPRRPWSSAT
jgi:hypothetical protein